MERRRTKWTKNEFLMVVSVESTSFEENQNLGTTPFLMNIQFYPIQSETESELPAELNNLNVQSNSCVASDDIDDVSQKVTAIRIEGTVKK